MTTMTMTHSAGIEKVHEVINKSFSETMSHDSVESDLTVLRNTLMLFVGSNPCKKFTKIKSNS